MAALLTSGLQRLTQTSATTFQTFPHKRSAALRCSGAAATLNGGWIPSNTKCTTT